MKTLFEQVDSFTIKRWTVVLYEGLWMAADPRVPDGDWHPEYDDRSCDTFAEAIEYAQKQARS